MMRVRETAGIRMSQRARTHAGVACCVVLACLGLLPARGLASSVVDDARELQRQMYYDEARDLLEDELDTLRDAERAQALLLLSQLSTDHKEVRRLLREAHRASQSPEMQRAADLALAQLDYARGNYNSVRTRLRDYESDPDAALLVGKAFVALGNPQGALRALPDAGSDELAALLRGWAQRGVGNVQEARAVLELLLDGSGVQVRPTALLWKAECEAELGLHDDALATAAELQEAFPDAPEAILVEGTLASLRRQRPRTDELDASSGRVLLQIGAFEDRANALRFRDGLPRNIGPLRVDEIRRGVRRLYRVHVGPFETREIAEAYGRQQLDPIDVDWQLSQVESP